jgi:S-adenosylmethionine synthetase
MRLNSPELRQAVPIGPDVKVMGLRRGDQVELTVSAAVLARRVASAREYRDAVSAVRDDVIALATRHGERSVVVAVNHAGDDLPYLTLSGSSAEAGDDGEVGRGNRFGGLITPYRPTSNEACAGKNPVSHVGKTYHCVAHDIARRLLADTAAAEATVGILSRIGDPVTHPAIVHVETVGAVDPADVRAVAEAGLADWRGVRDRLLAGEYELF